MSIADRLYKLTHPSETKRDALIATAVPDPNGQTVHWGKVDFTTAEFAKFKKNMEAIDFDATQVAVLQAVHDGTPVPGTQPLTTATTTQQMIATATYDKAGNMHIGKLTVEKGCVDDFTKVMDEGRPDAEFAAMIEKATKDGRTIKRDDGANSRAAGNTVVYWDPAHVASDFHNEASMSARDVLKHEMSHSLRDPKVQKVLIGIPDGVYTNREERMAIESEHRNMDPNQMQRHSHEANTVRTQDDVNKAPQNSTKPELAFNLQELDATGQPGSSVYKNSGQVRGQVQKIEHKDGVETITLKDSRGKLQQLSFRESTAAYHTEPWHAHPMKTLTEGLKQGDDVTLSFDPRNNTATLANRTQSSERSVDPQGHVVNERTVDFTKADRPLAHAR